HSTHLLLKILAPEAAFALSSAAAELQTTTNISNIQQTDCRSLTFTSFASIFSPVAHPCDQVFSMIPERSATLRCSQCSKMHPLCSKNRPPEDTPRSPSP